jgi:hypothetical protein
MYAEAQAADNDINALRECSKRFDSMLTALLTVNLLVSLASAGASGVALLRPAYLSGSSQISRGEIIYVRMYAARAIPFGVAAGLIPFWRNGASVTWLLLTAAIVQMLDVFIGIEKKDRGMTIGASIATIVHLSCALIIRIGHP